MSTYSVDPFVSFLGLFYCEDQLLQINLFFARHPFYKRGVRKESSSLANKIFAKWFSINCPLLLLVVVWTDTWELVATTPLPTLIMPHLQDN